MNKIVRTKFNREEIDTLSINLKNEFSLESKPKMIYVGFVPSVIIRGARNDMFVTSYMLSSVLFKARNTFIPASLLNYLNNTITRKLKGNGHFPNSVYELKDRVIELIEIHQFKPSPEPTPTLEPPFVFNPRMRRMKSVKLEFTFPKKMEVSEKVLREITRFYPMINSVAKDYGVKRRLTVSFKTRATRTLYGWCEGSEIRIYPNRPFLILKTKMMRGGMDKNEVILDTYLHEVAHALDRSGRVHGYQFKSIYRELVRRCGYEVLNDDWTRYTKDIRRIEE